MDAELRQIKKIQKRGSTKEADLLIRAYYNEIYIFVYKQLNNKDQAMDITQEIFISMLQTIHSYNSSKASFRTWLYRIATNKIIDYRRKYRPVMLQIDELECSDESADFMNGINDRELIKQIEAYVNCFELKIQQIYRLKIYGDYTFKEIASVMEEPESTVKSTYYRFINQLRKEFHDEYTNAYRG